MEWIFSFNFKLPVTFADCIQLNFYPGRLPDKLLYQWQQPLLATYSSVKNGCSPSPPPTGHHRVFQKIESNWKTLKFGNSWTARRWKNMKINETSYAKISLTELVSQDTILFVRTRSYLLRLLAFTFFSHWVGSTALWHVSTVGKREIRVVWT